MNNYKYKKVLVTGATGILGSWMVNSLRENNIETLGIALDKSKGISPDDIRRDITVIMPSLDLLGKTK